MIDLRFAKVALNRQGCVSYFEDGTKWGALPHDEPHYQYLAYRYGHEGDTVAYCQTHELCHHLSQEGFNRRSSVLWELAHGETPDPHVAASEEALAMALHRYIMTAEPPMIEGLNWSGLKTRFHTIMAGDNAVELIEQFRSEDV